MNLVATDGYHGLPDAAPFDRIIATCAITHIPPSWIRQLAPGGRIVAPMLAEGWPLIILDKMTDHAVTGCIDPCPMIFMPLRSKADNPFADGRGPSRRPGGLGQCGTTDLEPWSVADSDQDYRLFLALHIPGLIIGEVADRRHDIITLTSPQGYTEVNVTRGADHRWDVVQYGQRLWDTAEHAHRAWTRLGRPERTRYGIIAADDVERQYVWLDDPDGRNTWPMPL